MPFNQTSFKQGNKVAQKSPKIVVRKFKEMLANAKSNNDILCFQDACSSINWRDSKVDYWVKKNAVFEMLKRDIQNAIVSRINKGALNGDFNPTASIWREKQLGETDSQHFDHTTKGNEIKQTQIIAQTQEQANEIKELLKKFE